MSDYLQDEYSNKSFAVIKKFFFEICLAISYMHSKQLIHRDIKLSNILLDLNNEIVKLIDFGFAINENANDYIYWRCGTPGYMAPEI